MISEHKNEYQFDGDGRPVVDKEGMRNYHMSEPPSTALTTSIRSYQVWSTVLGSSLATIFANGNKAETKVFAGKAVIGKQGTVGIGWRTADPVTGTLGRFSYTSEYGTSFIKEETEPLGQQIDLQDSEEPPEPTYETRLGSVDDPQWQCQVQRYFGGFQAMPWSCQFATKDTQTYEPRKEESVVLLNLKIDKTAPAIFSKSDKAGYSVNLMRNAALTSSTKEDGGTGCDSDGDGKPDTPCTVKGPDLPIEIPGFVDASEPSNKIVRRKITEKEAKKIADDIQLILDNNPDCLEFINAILAKAQSDANPIVSKNPLDVFWAIYQQKGFYIVENLDAGGHAIGSIAKGTAFVELNARNYDLSSLTTVLQSKKSLDNWRRMNELLQAMTALNEVIHLSGAFLFDDRDMGRATAEYLGIEPPNYGFNSKTDVQSWSNWWHPKVYSKCSISRVMENESRRRRR